MDKQHTNKNILENITKKKFTYVIVIILVILSGFVLFNHIAFLNKNYKQKTQDTQNKDNQVNKILILSFIPLINLMFIP